MQAASNPPAPGQIAYIIESNFSKSLSKISVKIGGSIYTLLFFEIY